MPPASTAKTPAFEPSNQNGLARHACGGAATRFGAGGSSAANEPLEQDVLQVAASIEDGEHDDRPPGDAIDDPVGAHHELPPGLQAEAEQLRHQAAPAGMRHQRGGSGLE